MMGASLTFRPGADRGTQVFSRRGYCGGYAVRATGTKSGLVAKIQLIYNLHVRIEFCDRCGLDSIRQGG